MDLLQISQKIWRYRIVTLPVLALTLLGGIYVVALKASEYSATSTYVLINPPAPPTADEIARDPALGRIDPDNPYTRFTDQSVVVSLMSSTLSSESARTALSEAGADRRYTVAPSSQFGFGSSIVEITGVGSTPDAAMETARLVGAALTSELDRLQASHGVATRYRIGAQRVLAPDHAEERVSGKLRPLIAVLALGAILLFLVVSAADGLTALRAEWSRRGVAQDREDSIGVAQDREDSIEGTAADKSLAHQDGGPDSPVPKKPEPTRDEVAELTQPERILRELSVRGDGTPAPPGEVTLSGRLLRERTGIKSASMRAVTSKLRSEGKIERDERGWWKLSARQPAAGNGHHPQGPLEEPTQDWRMEKA